MFPAWDRRGFLRLLLGTAAFAPLAATAAGQGHGDFGVTPLGDRARLVTVAGSNVVVLDGGGGLLLVNGGPAAHADTLLTAIAAGTGNKRLEVLFNTDWHPDHTGLNEAAGRAGAQMIAHEHTRQYLGAEFFVDWENRTYKPLPSKALPNKPFYTKGALTFGGERVEYGHLGQAHTDGDIYVFFQDSNVLVAGDVLGVGRYPIADYTTGGWLGGLANATKTLLDLTNDQTRVVAGRGPVQTRADLQAQHQMLTAMRERLTKMMRQGLGSEEMLASGVTKEFDERWGDPSLFVTTSYRGLWLHVRELGGIV